MNDIKSREDAESYLRNATKAGRFDLFTSKLKTATIIRKRETKKNKLNDTDKQELCRIYSGVETLARKSDENVFRELVPKEEIAAWFNHTADILKRKINDPHWIRTGMLLEHDSAMFGSFCALAKHPDAAELTFEDTTVLKNMASMVLSRKGDADKLPDEIFVDNFILLVSDLFVYFDWEWKSYKFFKRLEATGILEQYFHCATFHQNDSLTDLLKKAFLSALIGDAKFVRKRLKEGTPCGDALRAIVDKSADRAAICSDTLPYLQTLVKLSTLLQIEDEDYCFHCKKVGPLSGFKCCGRCKTAEYCSQECQAADWKHHKKHCVPTTRPAQTHHGLSNNAIRQRLGEFYVHIMVRLVKACDKAGGLKMEEMVLEMDFKPDMSGRIPFLQDPPQFGVFPVSSYLDGTRPRVYGGRFDNVEESVECMVATLVEKLSYFEAQQKLSDLGKYPCLLSFELHPEVPLYSSHQLNCKVDMHRDLPIFTQEAVDGFRFAMVDDDYSHLYTYFGSRELVESFRGQIYELQGADEQ